MIDFTVTLKGLEQQLLGKLIGMVPCLRAIESTFGLLLPAAQVCDDGHSNVYRDETSLLFFYPPPIKLKEWIAVIAECIMHNAETHIWAKIHWQIGFPTAFHNPFAKVGEILMQFVRLHI